jgi:hypothetical protein
VAARAVSGAQLETYAQLARRRLIGGERLVDLQAETGLSAPTLRHHIALAVAAGLVDTHSAPRYSRARDWRPRRCMHCGRWSLNWDREAAEPSGYCSEKHLRLGRAERGMAEPEVPPCKLRVTCGRCGDRFWVLRERVTKEPRHCPECAQEERRRQAHRRYVRVRRVPRERRRCGLARCGKSFWANGRKLFCSPACKREQRLGAPVMAERTCLHCQAVFLVELGRHGGRARSGYYGRKHGPYCSARCADRFEALARARPEVEVVCQSCGTRFTVRVQGHRPPRMYCTRLCKGHARFRRGGPVLLFEAVCAGCGAGYNAARQSHQRVPPFCSEECRQTAGQAFSRGRFRLVQASCERCREGFTYLHTYDNFRRFCTTYCQRRAGAERQLVKRWTRVSPCVVCASDTRRGRPGIAPLWCSEACRRMLEAGQCWRRCRRCGEDFVAGAGRVSARLCSGCRGRPGRRAAEVEIDEELLVQVPRGSIPRAAGLCSEVVLCLGMAERGGTAARDRRLGEACHGLAQVARLLQAAGGGEAGVVRTAGESSLRQVEEEVDAVSHRLSGLSLLERRGQTGGARWRRELAAISQELSRARGGLDGARDRVQVAA